MVKILISGDFCPHARVKELINEKKFDEVFSEVIPITKACDYSVLNLECPVVINDDSKPINKIGPNIKTTIKTIEAIKYAKFNMITLANNHFYDYGQKGVEDTLTNCKKNDIDYVGGGINIKEAEEILYKRINNKTFAFINVCEHEFSIATVNTAGSNPLNPIRNFYQIQTAKKNADFVIMIIHGGHEHYSLPSPRMKETYRFFVDAGADVVVNHHQHCFSGYEVYKEKPIFYGLGNFSFDWDNRRDSNWNEGYFVVFEFNTRISFRLFPYIQGNKIAGISLMKANEKEAFNSMINKLNEIIINGGLLEKHFEEFVIKQNKKTKLIFEPYSNRYLKSLRVRNLIPSLISRKKLMVILNYIICESHKDIVINNLLRNLTKK